MTKNLLRLGLVLAVCGAMMACKKKGQPEEPPAPVAEGAEPGQPQELPGEAAEAAEEAPEAAGEPTKKAAE